MLKIDKMNMVLAMFYIHTHMHTYTYAYIHICLLFFLMVNRSLSTNPTFYKIILGSSLAEH